MSRASIVARGRRAAEAGMVDACTIRRDTGATTTDQDTGEETRVWTQVYAGKCRMQQGLAQAAQSDAGQDYILQLRLELQLPMSVVGLEVGDEAILTVSRDPDLIGRPFLIRDLFHKTDATARRVGVTERTD